jgi:hypothetical protein
MAFMHKVMNEKDKELKDSWFRPPTEATARPGDKRTH